MWRWAGLCLTVLNLTEVSAKPWCYYLSQGTLATKLPGRGRAWNKTHWPLSLPTGCPVFSFTIAWGMVKEVASPSGVLFQIFLTPSWYEKLIFLFELHNYIYILYFSSFRETLHYSGFVVGCALKTWLSLWTLPNVPNFHSSVEAFESKIWTITIYLNVVYLSNVKEGIKEIDGESWKIRIWSR